MLALHANACQVWLCQISLQYDMLYTITWHKQQPGGKANISYLTQYHVFTTATWTLLKSCTASCLFQLRTDTPRLRECVSERSLQILRWEIIMWWGLSPVNAIIEIIFQTIYILLHLERILLRDKRKIQNKMWPSDSWSWMSFFFFFLIENYNFLFQVCAPLKT